MAAHRPGPRKTYTVRLDTHFRSLVQRRSFIEYLAGLLAPHDRTKTLTALAGAEPVVRTQAAAVEHLPFFVSEAPWEADAINNPRLVLRREQAATAPHPNRIRIFDDTGDRKGGAGTKHIARQYFGSVGKINEGIVAVTTLWADGCCHQPVYVEPYTPAARLPEGRHDPPTSRTQRQMALTLIEDAQTFGLPFRAVVADCFYGDHDGLMAALFERAIPYVLARRGWVGPEEPPVQAAHSFEDTVLELPRHAQQVVNRRIPDGHTESWWAAELTLFGHGPQQLERAIVATTDPHTLPPPTPGCLSTNLSGVDASFAETGPWGTAPSASAGGMRFRRAETPVAPPRVDGLALGFTYGLQGAGKNSCSASSSGVLAQSLPAGSHLPDPRAMVFPVLEGMEPLSAPPEFAALLAAVSTRYGIDLYLRD